MRMFYSLLIGSSGNVIMPCDMIFSPQGYIEVKDGGVLTVNSAFLQSIQDSWGGITVQSGGQLLLSDVSISDYNIIVKSGGCLIIDNNNTIFGAHSITIEDGGYLCVKSGATINLLSENSLIYVSTDAIMGCPACNDNCITSKAGLSFYGEGHIIAYESSNYIQNANVSIDYRVLGTSVNAGYDVTTAIPYGNVVIEDGGKLNIDADEVILTKGVEVKLGGTLIIK